jgi:hypothetical protein
MKKEVFVCSLVFIFLFVSLVSADTLLDTKYPTSYKILLSDYFPAGSEYYNGSITIYIKAGSNEDDKYASSCTISSTDKDNVVLGLKNPSGLLVASYTFATHGIGSSYSSVTFSGLTNLPINGSNISVGVKCGTSMIASTNSHPYYAHIENHSGIISNSCTPTNCAANTCVGSSCTDCGISVPGTKTTGACSTCTPNCDLAENTCAGLIINNSCNTGTCIGTKECSEDQIMFRIYQENNSHVSIWNTSSYPLFITYDDVFNFSYSGSNPHSCTGTNTLFYLSAENNSHLSNSSGNGYNVPVCYGDLSCSVNFNSCTSDYKPVVRLYNYTNTHVSNLNDFNYPYLLCCKTLGSGVSLSADLKWKNMLGVDISGANVSDDVVIYLGQSNVDFSIVNAQTGAVIYSSHSNENFTFWQATAGNYSFNITTSTGSKLYSSNLTVLGSSDSSPNAKIDSPVYYILGQHYSLGYSIPFIHSSQDSDDLLTLVWDFANGTGSQVSFGMFSLFEKLLKNPTFGNINKSYAVAGIYDVKLTANERGRSLRSSNYTRVVVLQPGINVVPIISSPEKGKSMGTDVVSFDASQTYVVNCSTTMSPFNFTTIDGGLNCKYLHSPGSYTGANLPSSYSLNFKWDLGDGRIIENKWNSSTYYGIVKFVYRYADEGEHIAGLEVTYN